MTMTLQALNLTGSVVELTVEDKNYRKTFELDFGTAPQAKQFVEWLNSTLDGD